MLRYVPYGFLVFTGVMHFLIDVVSQYLRHKRAPSAETTLYYGLNSAYALGQLVLGLLGLWLAWRARELVRETPMVAISLLAAAGWLTLTFLFMEYREPRYAAATFTVLLVTAAIWP